MDIWDKIMYTRDKELDEWIAAEHQKDLKRKCVNCGESPAYERRFSAGPLYETVFCDNCAKRYTNKWWTFEKGVG